MIKISNSICIQQGFWCSKLLICCCVRFPTINWKIGGYRTDLITSCKNKHSLGSGIFCRQVEWYFRSVKICCGCRQHKCEPERLWYFRISNDFQDYDTLWRYGSLRIIWGRDCSFFQCLAWVNPSGVTPELLAKIWRIDNATAKRTVKVTTQLSRQDSNTSLSQNFGTNDRIVRYRSISSFFCTDCFFVTKKLGCRKASSSWLFTYIQCFVSDQGYFFCANQERQIIPKGTADFCNRIRYTSIFDCGPKFKAKF